MSHVPPGYASSMLIKGTKTPGRETTCRDKSSWSLGGLVTGLLNLEPEPEPSSSGLVPSARHEHCAGPADCGPKVPPRKPLHQVSDRALALQGPLVGGRFVTQVSKCCKWTELKLARAPDWHALPTTTIYVLFQV